MGPHVAWAGECWGYRDTSPCLANGGVSNLSLEEKVAACS